MVDENDRVVTPAAAPEVEAAPRYMWTATHTAAKDAIIYRRAIAEDPQAVPLRVWQFCEENGVDVCLFDGVRAREVTELEEALALSPPHAHAQIRNDGRIGDAADFGRTIPIDLPDVYPAPSPVSVQPVDSPPPEPSFPPSSTAQDFPQSPEPWVAPAPEQIAHEAPASQDSSGE